MKIFTTYCFIFFASCIVQAQGKIDSVEILHQAEMKRMPWSQMSLTAQLTDSNTILPAAIYHVFLSGDNALVIFNKPETTKGNLLLMKKNDLWIFIKGTKQATKITALQRMSGAVSYVDLARLNWSLDYKIRSYEKVKILNTQNEMILLHLEALTKENAYQKINLWINKQNKRPAKAEIFLGSGRLFKTIQFTKYEKTEDKEINTQIVLTDHLAGNKNSVIDISGIRKEKMIPAYYFIKDSLQGISKQIMH
jgi:outer membrane lipoprotein-sorting protein